MKQHSALLAIGLGAPACTALEGLSFCPARCLSSSAVTPDVGPRPSIRCVGASVCVRRAEPRVRPLAHLSSSSPRDKAGVPSQPHAELASAHGRPGLNSPQRHEHHTASEAPQPRAQTTEASPTPQRAEGGPPSWAVAAGTSSSSQRIGRERWPRPRPGCRVWLLSMRCALPMAGVLAAVKGPGGADLPSRPSVGCSSSRWPRPRGPSRPSPCGRARSHVRRARRVKWRRL